MHELVVEPRETVAIFLTNGNTLLENKCQRASETRLHEPSVTGMCYHCVSKRCLCSGGAWMRHLCFRSSPASLRALAYTWNLLRAYSYRWPGFCMDLPSSSYQPLVSFPNPSHGGKEGLNPSFSPCDGSGNETNQPRRMSCLYTYM